ncbi:hypothetical protein ACB092_01G273700 [Castanea dentata]
MPLLLLLLDPEFYEFLKEHDEELLQFNDEDIDEDVTTDVEDAATDVEDADLQGDDEIGRHRVAEKKEKPSKNVITTAMVGSWCNSVQEKGNISAVRSLTRAFRTACHYGDDGGDDSSTKFSIMSSSVFNITRDLRRDVYLVIDIVFFVNTDVINNYFGSV